MRSVADHLEWLRAMERDFRKEIELLSVQFPQPLPTEQEVLAVTTSDYSRGFAEGYEIGKAEGRNEALTEAGYEPPRKFVPSSAFDTDCGHPEHYTLTPSHRRACLQGNGLYGMPRREPPKPVPRGRR